MALYTPRRASFADGLAFLRIREGDASVARVATAGANQDGRMARAVSACHSVAGRGRCSAASDLPMCVGPI